MRIFFLSYLIIYASTIVGQTLPDELAPPNGIKIKDNLYIDKTEIANIHWLEFMHYLNLDSSKAVYEAMLPDTTVWAAVSGLDSVWGGSHYFRFPKSRYKPLVGVTREQAIKYNEWRSHAVNILFNEKHRDILIENSIDSIIYEFRLPTAKEWEMAAYGSLSPTSFGMHDRPLEKRDLILNQLDNLGVKSILGDTVNLRTLRRKLKKYTQTERLALQVLPDSIPYFVTVRDLIPILIHNGPTNYLGLSHVVGNVAEMTTEPNRVKGGSWLNKIDDINLDKGRYWDEKPNVWVGFRSICDVTIVGVKKAE